MNIFIIVLVVLLTLLLNILFFKKIGNKTYKICISIVSIVLASVFVILFIAAGTVKNNLNSFIDLGINQIEKNIDEINPGALEKQMNTENIKQLLEESLEKSEVNGIEALAENIIKSKMKKYSSPALNTINSLEIESGKLSAKDVLLSVKDLSINAVTSFLKIVRIVLAVLYIILCFILFFLSLHLAKNQNGKSKGIVFGEEADKTFVGMKTE